MEQILGTPRDAEPRNCGVGIKVPPKARPQLCSFHAYSCWLRHDPINIAGASVILKCIAENGHAYTDEKPSPERIEVTRQLMLARGYQLDYEEGEDGAPEYYNPPPALKEHVRRMLEAEDYKMGNEIRPFISAPLHGPMGESIG